MDHIPHGDQGDESPPWCHERPRSPYDVYECAHSQALDRCLKCGAKAPGSREPEQRA